MASDDPDQEPRTIAVSARVHEHLRAMGMPDESANDTLERLLGLTPDPASTSGDDLSTPLPEDPVVPDSLATDPTTETAAVDPEDVPTPANAPTDVDASLGELAAVLGEDERERVTALIEQIADADPEALDGIVESLGADDATASAGRGASDDTDRDASDDTDRDASDDTDRDDTDRDDTDRDAEADDGSR